MEIDGRRALVTGAGRGIGRSVALALAREGASVVVADVDQAAGRAVADEIGGVFVHADVTRDEDVELMVAAADPLAILINNAGGYEPPVFPNAPLVHWDRVLDLNLRAVMTGIHFAVGAMEGRQGAIVSIASSAGLGLGVHPGPEYAAAKAAVIRLTACLEPLAGRGIRVNCVCPHTVATEAVRMKLAEVEANGEERPWDLQGTLLEPDDVAAAVVDLVQDDNLAGRVLVLRGGRPPRLLPATGA
jgi:NAD(P)-dependent dehydrogenase (short-subunit alcohol dehydrogenase family)